MICSFASPLKLRAIGVRSTFRRRTDGDGRHPANLDAEYGLTFPYPLSGSGRRVDRRWAMVRSPLRLSLAGQSVVEAVSWQIPCRFAQNQSTPRHSTPGLAARLDGKPKYKKKRPNIGLVCPNSHRLLTGGSPVVVTVRRPRSRQPMQPGDWLC